MKNKKRRKKKKAHKIKASFTGGRLTNYSGIWPIFKFMQKLKVIECLEQWICLPVGDNAQYPTGQILSSIVLGVLSGLNYNRLTSNLLVISRRTIVIVWMRLLDISEVALWY